MDAWNLFFGFVGVAGVVFSIYKYFREESKKEIEKAKVAMQKEKLRNIKYSLMGAFNTVDSIVQVPKKGKVSIDSLQNLARAARSQLYVIGKQVEIEYKQLEEWKYGKMFESVDSNIEEPISEKGK